MVGGKLIVNDIGQYGASYGGMHAWALAGSGDPAVRTVVPTASWSIPYQSLLPYDTLLMTYVAGFYATGFDPVIAATNSVNTGSNPGVNPPSGIPANNYSTELHRGFVEAMTGANIDDLKAILDSRTPRWDNIHIPVFIVQGTNDGLFTQNQATNAYQQLKQRGVPVRLYVGGIGHPPSNPDPASPEAQHIGAEILQWFDHYLKGVNNGIDQQVPIEYSRAIYFGNQWDGTTRSAATFPFGTPQRYYICTASPQGGTLSSASCPDAVPAAASNAYAGEGYEEEPVTGPSISKFLRQFTAGAPSPLGPTPNLKSFPGTLIYDSAPLAIPLDTAGLPGLDLRASSADYIPAGARGGAAAFQLDPKLYDVDPSGTARLITRGAFAEPLDAHSAASESVTPTHDVRFDVFGLSYLVPAGHRLRLTLSTEDVPYLRPTINPFVVALFAGSSLDMPSAAALQATNFNAVTQVLYAGPSTMTATEGATLSASLISPSSGSPVAGQPLNFAFQGGHYSATPDAGATASAAQPAAIQ